MQSNERWREVVSEIERVRTDIVTKVVEEMYTGPFWEGRYGKSGRIHAEQDVNHHLDNLVTAIRMDLISSPGYYYNYLQSVLLSRGMCTLHIRQTLDCMERHLAKHIPVYWPEIKPFLEAGTSGLSYNHPACRALAEHESSIAQAAAKRISAQDENVTVEDEEATYSDTKFLLSYLQDAVGKQRPEIFMDYFHWLSTSSTEPDRSAHDLQKIRKILLDEMIRVLKPEEAEPFRRLLESL